MFISIKRIERRVVDRKKMMWALFSCSIIVYILLMLKLNWVVISLMITILIITRGIYLYFLIKKLCKTDKVKLNSRLEALSKLIMTIGVFAIPLLTMYMISAELWMSLLMGFLLGIVINELIMSLCLTSIERWKKVKIYRFFLIDREGHVIEYGIEIKHLAPSSKSRIK